MQPRREGDKKSLSWPWLASPLSYWLGTSLKYHNWSSSLYEVVVAKPDGTMSGNSRADSLASSAMMTNLGGTGIDSIFLASWEAGLKISLYISSQMPLYLVTAVHHPGLFNQGDKIRRNRYRFNFPGLMGGRPEDLW